MGLEILSSLTAYLLEYTQYQFLYRESSHQTSIPTTTSATIDSRKISVLSGGDVHVLLFVCPQHLTYAEEMGMMMIMMIMMIVMMLMIIAIKMSISSTSIHIYCLKDSICITLAVTLHHSYAFNSAYYHIYIYILLSVHHWQKDSQSESNQLFINYLIFQVTIGAFSTRSALKL